MPKEHFQFDQMTPLSTIPANGKIHFIGVCGVAMGQLAANLAEQGYEVTGSDKEFYEPMGSYLKNSKVTLLRGYSASNIPEEVDLIVIGNTVSYGHEELAPVEERNLPYTCFPKLLRETVISDQTSIVACGTHGKSTTTAMITSTLKNMDLNPSYFVGAVSEDFGTSLAIASPDVSVVEGDEYDDVFFSKRAKFLHYAPTICIINAVEFDHADLYPTLDAMDEAFHKLVLGLPENAYAVCCIDYEHLNELQKEWKEKAKCKIITFGNHADADYRITSRKQNGLSQTFTFESEKTGSCTANLPVAGEYNAKNALATIISCQLQDLPLDETLKALNKYKAIKRRQEIRLEKDGLVLIEDFAHHPTAVGLTVTMLKEAFPDKKLWAIFEPRSNTSRRKVFQDDYIKGFQQADHAIISQIKTKAVDSGHELIDVDQLAAEISDKGTACAALPNADSIAEKLISEVGNNDVVVVMSNGSFDGLMAKLVDGFQRR